MRVFCCVRAREVSRVHRVDMSCASEFVADRSLLKRGKLSGLSNDCDCMTVYFLYAMCGRK